RHPEARRWRPTNREGHDSARIRTLRMTPAFHLRWDDEGRNHRPSVARQVVDLNFILPEDHLVSTPLGASAEQVRDPSLVTCLTAGCRRGDANDVALAHREDMSTHAAPRTPPPWRIVKIWRLPAGTEAVSPWRLPSSRQPKA